MSATTLREQLQTIATESPSTEPVGSAANVATYFDRVYNRAGHPAVLPAPAPKPEPQMTVREIDIRTEAHLVAGFPGPECHWTQVGNGVWVDGLTGARFTWRPLVDLFHGTLETPMREGRPQ